MSAAKKMKIPHEADVLSFMHRKSRDVGGICYWSVEPSGHFGRDCDKGHELAREYLDFIGKYPTNGATTLLGCIVNDMVRARQEERKHSGNHLTGIEIGFLGEVNKYAMSVAKAIRQTMGKPVEGGAA
ncbi:hypothetical protein EN844_24685 [Mesorhizobium sp. M3A.F.Ca.ET.201.01.1.1]|uniref:hypothetical protein n=1 Tax=Mesorhizobium sp. M3A.F.Ca.ET.201.01.1.1 TaxID=2563946 RepID=UPI0010933AC5|nr:hypothetical protein [Mesorhizobium sp. M3A.F.Ca.ET.201.01.1.1]TGS63029.1 hypothetical protein EN844_24685 [Mesorhizobium sp. M3A.F.Ca.ET.201.01.1.1]